MLNIVIVLKEWKAFLHSTMELFKIVTDYKNLIEFLTIKELNWRLIKWAEMLVEYYFKIKHVKGIDNIKVDTLSRKAGP